MSMNRDDADTTTTTAAIIQKISSPLIASLLSIHPNDAIRQGYELPSHWSSWWTWASDHAAIHPDRAPAWLQLVHYFMRPNDDSDGPGADIPPQLCSLIDSVRSLQLQRTPLDYDTRTPRDRAYRISPKKAHEVDRMSSYVHHMLCSEDRRSVWHAVDIGSGQGYLSRALQGLDFHVLALDHDEHQTSGANQWTTKEAARKLKREHRTKLGGVGKPTSNLSPRLRAESTEQEEVYGHPQRQDSHSQAVNDSQKGSLTHRTVHVCPRTLEESVDDWFIESSGTGRHDVRHSLGRPEPVPVMLVALHACGSLTVDVLRTFLLNRARTLSPEDAVHRAWTPHSLVVVGCCYNLMSHSDFPLSKPLREMEPMPKLTTAAVHLAAQIPSQWLKSKDSTQAAELALRKVVYRALLQPVLQVAAARLSTGPDDATISGRPIQPGHGETMENRRLGKLNIKAYQDWPTFLARATDKLGIDLAAISTPLPTWFVHEATRTKMEGALFALQALRCILGPLIETLILLDRRDWIQQESSEMNEGGKEVEVALINMFDQSTGSGRNVALVVKPVAFPQRDCAVIEQA